MALWLAVEQRSGPTLSLNPGDKFLTLLCQFSGAHPAMFCFEQAPISKKITVLFMHPFNAAFLDQGLS